MSVYGDDRWMPNRINQTNVGSCAALLQRCSCKQKSVYIVVHIGEKMKDNDLALAFVGYDGNTIVTPDSRSRAFHHHVPLLLPDGAAPSLMQWG